ncbi:DUF1413 domain-containing protein [Morganella morganii subsp. sibonii]
MRITVEISDHTVKEALNYASDNCTEFEEIVSKALKLYIQDQRCDESTLAIALDRAYNFEPGKEFTLRQLLSDIWDRVESPRSFGRTFKEKVERSGHARVIGTNSSNQTIYVSGKINDPIVEFALNR